MTSVQGNIICIYSRNIWRILYKKLYLQYLQFFITDSNIFHWKFPLHSHLFANYEWIEFSLFPVYRQFFLSLMLMFFSFEFYLNIPRWYLLTSLNISHFCWYIMSCCCILSFSSFNISICFIKLILSCSKNAHRIATSSSFLLLASLDLFAASLFRLRFSQ